MLAYNSSSESSTNSHFFISKEDSIYLLNFCKIDIDEYCYDNDFLQDNIRDLSICAGTLLHRHWSKELVYTIKHIFDDYLTNTNNGIIQVIVDANSGKDNLIKHIISTDNNIHFHYFGFQVMNRISYYFINEKQTSSMTVLTSLLNHYINGFKQNFNIIL